MDNNRLYGRRRILKKRVRWWRLLFLLALFSGVFFACYKTYDVISYLFFTPSGIVSTMPEGTPQGQSGPAGRLNLLVLGLDDIDPDAPEALRRSDSIILVSFNISTKNIAALSIPRDTRVRIPQKVERDKINHAFRYGGAELARQTVADFLRVPVDCHIVLDPQGFVRIVDILGGINIYVENDMDYEDPYQDLYIHIKRGYQKLDGKTAMQYVRFRNDDLGDIGRMLRQQRFLKVFLDQLFSYSGLLKLPYLKPVIEEVVSTDLVAPTVFKMFRSFRSYGKEAVRFERLQGEPTTIDDISYLQTDPTEVKAMLDALDIAYIK